MSPQPAAGGGPEAAWRRATPAEYRWPSAAAVAACTAGLAGQVHMPKVVQRLSITVAAVMPPARTVC